MEVDLRERKAKWHWGAKRRSFAINWRSKKLYIKTIGIKRVEKNTNWVKTKSLWWDIRDLSIREKDLSTSSVISPWIETDINY